MEHVTIEKVVKDLIKATNQFDIKSTLKLFAADAIIDDVSVGEKFKNTSGVRVYIEKFFIGYNTVTKILSVEVTKPTEAKVLVDFTGDFGHETGGLNITVNSAGLIIGIDAYLD